MGNDNLKPLRKLGALDIYQKIVKGSRTLAEVAAEYDCSYDQFLTGAKKLVGPKEWRRVEKADERNSRIIRKEAKNKTYADPEREAEKRVLDISNESAVVTNDMSAIDNIGLDLSLLEEMLGVAAFALQDASYRLKRSELRVQAAGNESREAAARVQDAELFETSALHQYRRNRFCPNEGICKAIWEDAGQRSKKAKAIAARALSSFQEAKVIHEGIAGKHLVVERRFNELKQKIQMAQRN